MAEKPATNKFVNLTLLINNLHFISVHLQSQDLWYKFNSVIVTNDTIGHLRTLQTNDRYAETTLATSGLTLEFKTINSPQLHCYYLIPK